MNIDDRGLGGVIYSLMTGEAHREFCPGLNVLIRDESKPGGLLYRMKSGFEAAFQRFLAKHPNDAEAELLMITLKSEDIIWRDFALLIFQYGLQVSPMLRPFQGDMSDEETQWNWYWGASFDLLPEEDVNMLSDELIHSLNSFAAVPSKEDAPPKPTP